MANKSRQTVGAVNPRAAAARLHVERQITRKMIMDKHLPDDPLHNLKRALDEVNATS